MVESIGIDIADVGRFERLVDRYGERVVARVLGRRERQSYARRRDRAEYLAGRFAAKEAVIKALGRYLSVRPAFSSFEIVNDPSGRPVVELPDHLANKLRHVHIHVSISHEKNFAIGLAVCTEKS